MTYNILCPKRHIGPEAFVLVNDHVHCLKDPQRCHVIGQSILPPIVIRATTLNGVEDQSHDLRHRSNDLLKEAEKTDDEPRAEQLRSTIFAGIGRTVEQYVKLRGNTTLIEKNFEDWTFEDYWKNHSRSLAEATRNMLLSGEYIWNEYSEMDFKDWAPPAIQYCRALEFEIKRRLYDHCPKEYKLSKNNPHLTLGSVHYIYVNKHYGDSFDNWQIFARLVRQSLSDINEFTDIMKRLVDGQVAKHRNSLAHGDPVPKDIAELLRTSIIGKKKQPGILFWLAAHLDPVK